MNSVLNPNTQTVTSRNSRSQSDDYTPEALRCLHSIFLTSIKELSFLELVKKWMYSFGSRNSFISNIRPTTVE